ncbi:hypothetical protein J4G37_12580 [Microvirga sp. 3-52]|nr:hypothetical protein [Microvirga sp. 3-52]
MRVMHSPSPVWRRKPAQAASSGERGTCGLSPVGQVPSPCAGCAQGHDAVLGHTVLGHTLPVPHLPLSGTRLVTPAPVMAGLDPAIPML